MRLPILARYPLRPLTEAGRVLLCIAAAMFAALLLIAWTAAPAEESTPGAPLTSAIVAR